MRALVLLLMALGLAVGLLPMLSDLIQETFFAPEVDYNGVYEPLPGAAMSRAYETTTDISFEVRTGLIFDWWASILPLVGAGLGAALGVVLGSKGFRLTREPKA
ncbi:hypothetical protein [Rhodococcus sovatensis]|uniref:Cobalt/nickel transport protein n=1 Tax=Rhodococcus sovatensis TaxID=1805840 RepID=A0ABZ2PRM3_9NOCA